ncbi:MAG: phosphatase PAP2 family protein [Candidatus Cloacimonetes bacterium]|nr:phosphatase PAP2 family protein [Candidatus Cloacimonadota bacterium]
MPKYLLIELLIVLAILMAGTALFRLTDLDISIESAFYRPGDQPDSGWFLAEKQPWNAMYHAGNFPAMLLAGASLIILALGFQYRRWLPWRKATLFLALVMLIGPGLIVNMVFKDHWGRPRPRNITQFEGDSQFEPVWDRGIAGKGKSFPSGHASMAFYLITPWFLLRRKRKLLAATVLLAGLAYGLLMGITRMVQGGHFPSDVLWSAGFIYLTGLLLYYALGLHRSLAYTPATMKRRRWALWAAGPVLVLLALFVLLGTPYYRAKKRRLSQPLPERVQRFDISVPLGDVVLVSADNLLVRWEARGFGIPESSMRDELRADTTGTVVSIRFEQRVKGVFSELQNNVVIATPFARFDTLRITAEQGDIVLPSSFSKAIELLLLPPVDGLERIGSGLESELHNSRTVVIVWSAPKGTLRFALPESVLEGKSDE